MGNNYIYVNAVCELYYTAIPGIVLYNNALFLCYIGLQYTVLYGTVLHCTVLFCNVLYCSVCFVYSSNALVIDKVCDFYECIIPLCMNTFK